VKIPRLMIAWLMLGIAAIAFPCAIVGSILRNRPLFGLEHCLGMGLWPTIPVLAIYLFAMIRRRAMIRAFDIGFVAFGWAAVFVFVIDAWAFPAIMRYPIVFYINQIEPYFLDCDLQECYILSLFIQGAILAVPQLVTAVLGGLVVRRFVNQRVIDRSSRRALYVDC
jgi:hypothetical protein